MVTEADLTRAYKAYCDYAQRHGTGYNPREAVRAALVAVLGEKP